MNREDIIRIAREAGFADGVAEIVGLEGFDRFAVLVAAAERERCAEICDSVAANAVLGTANECARAIREKGSK